MEEKERYKIDKSTNYYTNTIVDTKTNTYYGNIEEHIDLLNQQNKENQQLKQQLAEKENEISNLNGLVRERDKQIKNLKTNKKRVIEHKNKTKISFAIEQLEKAKGLIANHIQELWTCENDDIDVVLYEEIDNQINELKGNVEDAN